MRPGIVVFVCSLCATGGAEQFRLHETIYKVGPYPSAIALADLDGNGAVDILTADRGRLSDPRDERPGEEYLTFLAASAPLEYRPQPQLRTGIGPYAIRIANIDALRAPDIVVAGFMAARDRDLTLLRNLGDHVFEPVHFQVSDDQLRYERTRDGDGEPLFTTPGLTSLDIADIDKDGYRDVLATGWSSDVLVFFRGHADEYFEPAQLIPLPGGPRDVRLSDINRDDHVDAVVSLYSAGEIAILLGDGSGAFELASRFPSRGHLPHKIAVARFNNDRWPDIAVSHAHAEDSVVVFFGEDGLRFSNSQEIELGTDRTRTEVGIRDMIVSDFDGNGSNDIVCAGAVDGQVHVLLTEKPASPPRIQFRREAYSFPEGQPRALAKADLDGDNTPDIAVALWEPDSVAILLNK